jgi:NhaP-type Na+/H+ or K+/H+ antiporter
VDQVGVVAVVVVAYGLVSRLLERTPLTVPLAFTAAGMAAGGLGLVEQDLTGGPVLTLLELTLVVVLFSDAARIDLGAVRRTGGTIPLRLLGLGMPLTIGLGVLAAAVLLPTDAALGQEVVSSRLVPVRIRQAVNVESGLNDGLSVPFLTLFVALAVEEAGEALDWVAFTGQQIGLGVATGVVVGLAGGAALEAADRREWVNAPFRQLTVVALAVLAWAGADAVGGNGFIAAFVAGLATGAVIQDSGDDLLEFTEDEGQLLTAVVFFVFGVAAPGFLEAVSPAVVVYAALSLTVLRMLPVAIALLGSGLRPSTVLLLGWFGPRGLASIILALVVAEEAPDLPHLDVVMAAMALTVLASTVLHGATARPLVQRYGHFVDRLPADAPELTAAADLPVRGSLSDPPG